MNSKPVETPHGPSESPPRPRWSLLRWLSFGLASVVFALSLLVLSVWLRQAPEPRHAGRALSAWLEDLGSPAAEKREPATNAIVGLGTNAVPFLVQSLSVRDPTFGHAAIESRKYLPRWLWLSVMRLAQPRAGIDRRWPAASALALLGPAALPALPALTGAAQDPDPRVRGAAIEALRRLGPPGLPPLVQAMHTARDERLHELCYAVTRTGPLAADVAPQLVTVLVETPPALRAPVTQALKAMGGPAVAPLAKRLRSERAEEQEAVLDALAALTADNYDALKAVIALLDDPDPALRRGAVRVLAVETGWSRRVVSGLTRALQDAEPSVRGAAVEALVRAAAWTDGVTNALPALRSLASSASGPERATAAAAVARLEGLRSAP